MKTLVYVFIAVTLLASCKSDDETAPVQNFGTHFPSIEDSFWNYNNTSSQGASRDSLYIVSSSIINDEATVTLGLGGAAEGFMTNLLSSGTLTTSGSKLLLNGVLSAPIDGFPDVTIPITNMVIYDLSASAPETMSSEGGRLEEVVSDIPIVIDYVISSNHILTVSDEGANGTIYYPKTNIVVNLAISAQIVFGGVTLDIPILAAQDVIVSENLFESEVGLTSSDVSINYQLEDLSGLPIELPIPSEGSEEAFQDLDTYMIEN
ncbi:hypothetical protein [Ulvibacter antarcticus]|uniref:Uncharacterized protein n=1 Tax=Ulvibacter antarcticus TaxID=442714 RepID=A0A3L9YWQ5_9FLAO|nr:hypothetical protein [Ulvibacter antarcticus]RMA64247.1 hypothetical protein BXY75_1120 [Ulvibacter antarcticus]